MITKNYKLKNQEIILESFNGMLELVKTNDSRKNNFGYDRKVKGRDFNFSSYEQAVSWLLNYDKHLDMFKKEIKNLDIKISTDSKKVKTFNSVEGYQPIIPNALMGLPNSMVNSKVSYKKNKVINVLVDATYSWHTTEQEVARSYSKQLAYLSLLEKQGFRVRLELGFIFGTRFSNKIHICKILLKNESQPLDIKRLMFGLTNLGSFRLFGWDWYERLPKAEQIDGYGSPMYSWDSEKRNALLESIGTIQNKQYYLHLNSNVEQVFESVK